MPAAALVGGSIVSGLIGAHGAHSAADQQAAAAQKALGLIKDENQKGIDAQTAATSQIQGYQQPYLSAGTNGLSTLSGMLKTPGQGLLSNYGDFKAPSMQDALNDPGYAFQLQQGTDAINKDAALKGTLFSGNTGTALQQYGQGLASTTYGNVYNRALNSYLTNQNTFNQNQGNQFSRLGYLANLGQGAANTMSGYTQAGAQNLGNIYGNIGQQGAQQLNNVGAAQASGTVGAANAYGGIANSLGQLPLLNSMLRKPSTPAFGNLSPTQISGAFGGSTQVPLMSDGYQMPSVITS